MPGISERLSTITDPEDLQARAVRETEEGLRSNDAESPRALYTQKQMVAELMRIGFAADEEEAEMIIQDIQPTIAVDDASEMVMYELESILPEEHLIAELIKRRVTRNENEARTLMSQKQIKPNPVLERKYDIKAYDLDIALKWLDVPKDGGGQETQKLAA